MKQDSITKSICENIKKFIDNNENVTNVSFAKHFGVAEGTVRNWKAGVNAPAISLLESMAEYMNISLIDFLGIDNKVELSNDEKELLRLYKSDKAFRALIKKCLTDKEFASAYLKFVNLINDK